MQKRKHFKSIISLLLVSLILMSCFPITASAKSEVIDIKIDPITIIEGTYGDYDYLDGYFKYEPEDLINFTVVFEEGQSYSSKGYSFDYDGEWYWFETETDQSLDNQWAVGNTYTMTVSLEGVSVEVPVTITDTPVEKIEVKPVSIIEYTNGAWQEEFNNESGKYERSYYYYDFSEYTAGTIYFQDGTSAEFYGETNCEFEYNGETYWVTVTDDQSPSNQWTAGNEYNVKFEAMGVTANMPVTIEESPIESIEIAPISLFEYTHGGWQYEDDEEYYLYEITPHLECTVTFDNGDVNKFEGDRIVYKDETYLIEVTDDQSIDNQWTAGNAYKFTVDVMGFTAEGEVYIDYSPVQSIELKPASIYEYSNGYLDILSETESYFHYDFISLMEYTVTFKNGEATSGTGNDLYYGDYGMYFDCIDPQSIDNQWTAGNTYEIECELAGVKSTLEVEIMNVPIVSVEIEPLEIIENTSGYFDSDFYEETDEYSELYYHYSPKEYINYIVTFEDGSTVSGSNGSFVFDDNTYFFEVTTDQSYDNQWTVGNTYSYTAKLLDVEAEGEVTIIENPIESVEVKPVTVYEGINGRYTGSQDFDTGEWIEYFYYEPIYALEYTVTFKDGSVVNGSGDTFEYDGKVYPINETNDQSYENAWQVGNTYTAQLEFMGKFIDFEVKVEGHTYGDVNCDGVADISDVTYIQKFLASLTDFSYTENKMADVNGDEEVTIDDATYIQKMLVGLV